MKKIIPVIIILLIAAIVIGPKFLKKSKPGEPVFQKGMVYVTWSENGYNTGESDTSMTEVKNLGSDWISILVTWYQTNSWSTDIRRTSKTPSDESVVHAIRKAHELGMKVVLKLHLDLLDKSDGSWRGEIGSTKESEWEEWFRQYKTFVNYYADMAKKEKVEMVCIGTELSTAATVKGYMWNDVIKSARSKYNGALTYAAHWDRYQDIRFWDQLDYVGINAYFPLTEKMVPSYEELIEGWQRWLPEIEEFQARIGKPVIFPEIGCNSADGAAIRPWEHAPRSEVNLQLQTDYYKALLDTFWNKEWFYGLYWWYWGTNTNMGGKYNRGFTPQNKPSSDVVKKWYAKSVKK